MFFGFLHTLVMRKIKKSQKDFCEQEINYVTRIESSSNMENQSDEDVCFVGIRKMAKKITATQNWKWLNFSHLCHLW